MTKLSSSDPAALAALVASAEAMAREAGTLEAPGRLGEAVPTDLLVSMGMLVMVWAQAEVAFDAAISIILFDLEGKRRLGESVVPVALKRKLDLWKKAHAKIPSLKPHADLASAIAADLGRLSQERHNIIHGAAMQAQSDGSFAFFRSYPRKGGIEPHLTTYSPEQIGDLTLEMVQASIRLTGYVHRLYRDHGATPEPGEGTVQSFIEAELVRRRSPQSR